MYDYGTTVNWLHVIVSAAASMGLMMLWYSPKLFGKQWMALSGMGEMTPEKMAEMKIQSKPMFAVQAVLSIIMAYVLANAIASTRIYSVGGAMQLAFWIWLGFVAAPMYSEMLWAKKPKKLWAIGAGHYLAGMLLMAAILAGWR